MSNSPKQADLSPYDNFNTAFREASPHLQEGIVKLANQAIHQPKILYQMANEVPNVELQTIGVTRKPKDEVFGVEGEDISTRANKITTNFTEGAKEFAVENGAIAAEVAGSVTGAMIGAALGGGVFSIPGAMIGGAVGGFLSSLAYSRVTKGKLDWSDYGNAAFAGLLGLIPGGGARIATAICSKIGFKAIGSGLIKGGFKLAVNTLAVPVKTLIHGITHALTGGLYGLARTALPAMMNGTAQGAEYQQKLTKNTMAGAVTGGVVGAVLGLGASLWSFGRSFFAASGSSAGGTTVVNTVVPAAENTVNTVVAKGLSKKMVVGALATGVGIGFVGRKYAETGKLPWSTAELEQGQPTGQPLAPVQEQPAHQVAGMNYSGAAANMYGGGTQFSTFVNPYAYSV